MIRVYRSDSYKEHVVIGLVLHMYVCVTAKIGESNSPSLAEQYDYNMLITGNEFSNVRKQGLKVPSPPKTLSTYAAISDVLTITFGLNESMNPCCIS